MSDLAQAGREGGAVSETPITDAELQEIEQRLRAAVLLSGNPFAEQILAEFERRMASPDAQREYVAEVEAAMRRAIEAFEPVWRRLAGELPEGPFVILTGGDGTRIAIRARLIQQVYGYAEESTGVRVEGSGLYSITESFEEVLRRIQEAEAWGSQ